MKVQAAPKTQPGGVHGALFRSRYQVVLGPLSIKMVPNANAPKLIIRKMMVKTIFIVSTWLSYRLMDLLRNNKSQLKILQYR